MDFPQGVLWSFGHGLSYTTFTYAVSTAAPAPISLAPLHALLAATEGLFPKKPTTPLTKFSVNVTNTGKVDADDVVLGFLTPPSAGVGGVPLKQLFGFERVHIRAGQTVTVYLAASALDFATVGQDGTRAAQPGEYTVSFGVREALAQGMGFAEQAIRTEW